MQIMWTLWVWTSTSKLKIKSVNEDYNNVTFTVSMMKSVSTYLHPSDVS